HSVYFAHFVDRRDVGMVHGRRALRLADQPGSLLLVYHQQRPQHFQRHQPLQLLVLGLENDAHATSTQLSEDSEVAQAMDDKPVVDRPGRKQRRKVGSSRYLPKQIMPRAPFRTVDVIQGLRSWARVLCFGRIPWLQAILQRSSAFEERELCRNLEQ